MGFPKLETERLLLRELTLLDAEAMFHYFSKESVIRYFGMDSFENIEQAKTTIQTFRKRNEEGSVFRWGIEKKGTDQLIGTCGFHLINKHHKRAEIGYELDDTYWGQGYATEALQAMLAYGFETLHLIRIAAVVYIENEASRNLLKKAGFQEEGLLRKYMIQNDVAHDTVVYSLLKEDWQK
ncbi:MULTISPECIES: GNAT family N-acetyltransferase [Bacillus cereus group]|uniref:Acetyltransferase n=1 Tax=Bacillus mycoides TaxID=1405 RepID=A0A120EGQ7_BACMY|nr:MULTISPECIES: GNAT family protein [Bacillus cereus group]KWU62653.1 acetyltransferase [Bacillus mycoides]MBJ7957137.1 GNAT family N-acetyltransferase [Bacillus cereus group sp. N28]MED1058560.1 GNAT family protein [Bacillus mycoides]MED1284232.1 GNAT family protein [Bacillus mycoides]WJE74482.1 GNAT family protein [Bacillus mycoides]